MARSKMFNVSGWHKAKPSEQAVGIDGPAQTEVPLSADGYDHSPAPWMTWRVFFMAILVSIGGFIFGYDTGQISGFLGMQNFLQEFGELNTETGEYYFTNVRTGLIVALLSIGTLIGALIAAPIADIIGRKWSIFWWCIMFHIGNIIQISSPTGKWYEVMMGRFVLGFSVGALSLMVPMYMAETAPPKIRGAMISCYQLFITLGIFIAACINFGTHKNYSNTAQWRIPMGIGFLWPLILGTGIIFFPETPRFNFRHGKVDKALATMEQMAGVTQQHWSVHCEFEEMRAKFEAEPVSRGSVRDFFVMFKAPKMLYRIALGMGLQMFQQLTGPFVTQLILNGINFGTTFIGLYLVEHYGRRKSLITGSTWMFVCFMIFASVGHFALDRETPTNTPQASIALIVFASFFILGFATTWGPMIWTIIGELYPSEYRAKAMALATASNWFWNFLLAFFTSFITADIDFRYGYVFASCNVIGGLIIYFFVIEGQGRTLEEIDTMYLEGVKPWQSDKWVAPPIDVMRQKGMPGYRGDTESAGDSGPDEKEEEAQAATAPAAI